MAYDLYQFRKGINNNSFNIPPDKVIAWITKHFDYKTRKNGSEYCINNPFNGDTGYNFNINPFKGKCHDWRGDEWAGPINPETNKRNCSFIKFVRLYKKCRYSEAISEVLGTSVDIRYYLKPENRVTDEKSRNKLSVTLPSEVEPLIKSNDSQAKILINWLNSRGYTEEDIIKNDLHHFGMDVYWPYYEFDTLVYWQSRSRLNKRFNFPSLDVYDKNNKVIGQVNGTKGDFLYGFDDVEFATYIIITEAIFDKHTLGEQALASGGAVLTSKQISKLKIIGPRHGVILSPDNDKAGLKSVISNYQLLSSYGFSVYFSIPPSLEYTKNNVKCFTKDWNEIGQYVTGFKNVRKIHDDGIKKITEETLVELDERISCLK